MPQPKRPLGLEQMVQVVNQMAETFDLGPLLVSIEQAAMTSLNCQRAQILEYDPHSEEFFRLLPFINHGGMQPLISTQPGDREFRISARTGAAGQAALTQRVITVPGTSGHQEALIVPLFTPEGELRGILHVQGNPEHRFADTERHFAQILGSLAAIAVKRQSLVDAAEQKQQLERELQLARDINELTLPRTAPDQADFELAASFHPAQWVGGDVYDYWSRGPQDMTFMIADATGHGLDSALIASRCRAYFRAFTSSGLALDQVARRINQLLCQELDGTDCFVAVTLGRLHGTSLAYINSGQPPPLVLRSGQGTCENQPVGSPPLGILPELDFEECRLQLEDRDLALFYSDGLVECRSPSGEMYGEDRLRQALLQCRELAPQELIQRIPQDVARFRRGQPQHDDQTCLVVRRRREP